MEESRKKPIMVGVIVACLVLAGIVFIKTRPPSGPDLKVFRYDTTWVKCRACGASYGMNLEKYFKFIEEHADPTSLLPPPLTCKECGEPAVYRAVKCAKCELVFEVGTIPADFSDRCPNPDCGFSQKEADRKKAAEERRAKRREEGG